ncbi:taste receptor type 2 member 9-like [Ascaphus truei]|uniref:taste receptor type 2 member 9-like n=1 Tax=Ascaphus truei TaxID=8439 RepID=UPI003F59CE9C
MPSSFVILLVISGILVMVGVMINSFIVAVPLVDWRKGNQLNAFDNILVSLGITRICYQCVALLESFIPVYFPNDAKFDILHIALLSGLIFFHFCNIWVSTLLSILYCVKIANYKHALFLHLKMRIPRMIPRLIVCSVLMSLLFICPVPLTITNGYVNNSTHDFTVNETRNSIDENVVIVCIVLGSVVPLVIFTISSVFLITSLWIHTKRMSCSDITFTTPRLDAHYAAIKSLTIYFLIHASHISFDVAFVSSYPLISNLLRLTIKMLINIFPTVHSSFLIQGTTKLKQASSKIFQYVIRRRNTKPNSRRTTETSIQ